MRYRLYDPFPGLVWVLGRLDLGLTLLFGSKLDLAEYWIHFKARFGGVHAFGYNSAESEPIWMKSGVL